MLATNNNKSNNTSYANTLGKIGRVKVADCLYFVIRLLSVIIVPLAAAATYRNYYVLTLDTQPFIETYFYHNISELNCNNNKDESPAVNENVEKDVMCEQRLFDYNFGLFQTTDDYFFFKENTGHMLCNAGNTTKTDIEATSKFLYATTANFTKLTSDLQTFYEGDIGRCNESSLITTKIFALVTLIFSIFTALWMTVLSGHFNNSVISVQVVLTTITMVSSWITIIVYYFKINPLRLADDDDGGSSSSCQRLSSSIFGDTCYEEMGDGFYYQLAVAFMSLSILIICAFNFFVVEYTTRCNFDDAQGQEIDERSERRKNNDDDNEANPTVDENDSQQETTSDDDVDDDGSDDYDDPQQYRTCLTVVKNQHLWIEFGRFLEFFLAISAFGLHFTSLEFMSPPRSDNNTENDDAPIQIITHLWDHKHGYCSDFFFFMNILNATESSSSSSSPHDGETYGDCDYASVYEVYMGFFKVVVFSGLALFFKRDAQRNPFFYLSGLLSDVVTMVFVAISISTFYNDIYPGRKDIDPSFCEQYESTIYDPSHHQYDDDSSTTAESNNNSHCSITLGPGFWILCVVQVLTVVNFVVEFIDNEIGTEYGARNAIETIVKRVRMGRIQDAVLIPASIYVPKNANDDRREADDESNNDASSV